MKGAPLGGKIKADTLLYIYIWHTKIVISYRTINSFKSPLLTWDQTATEHPTSQLINSLCVSHQDLSSYGWDGWLGWSSPWAPCPWSEGGTSLPLCPNDTLDEKGGFSLSPEHCNGGCWRLGALTPVRADFQLGARSPSERARVRMQPDLDHGA